MKFINFDSIIKKIRKNHIRKLLENFFSLSLLQISGYVFPIFTLPYLANVLGIEKFGLVAFSSAIIIYFQTIVDYGFNFTATRDIAKNKRNYSILSDIYSRVLWSKFLLLLISLLLLILLLIFIPQLNNIRALLLISFLILPGHILFTDWLFQGLEEMKFITILNVISKSVFTFSVFIFIKSESDYLLQPLFLAIGLFVSGLATQFIIKRKYNIIIKKASLKSIITTIKGSTDVFINQLFPNLYNSFSILLLGYFGGVQSNGIFEAAAKFVNFSQQFTIVISRTFFPYLSRNIEKHSVFSKINILISAIISITLFLLAPYLINTFFNKDYYPAILVLRILSISIIFLSLISTFGTNYLILQKHERLLRNITMFVSIFGFFISWPLIYYYNVIGAAVTILTTRAVFGLSIVVAARQIIKKKMSESINPQIPINN